MLAAVLLTGLVSLSPASAAGDLKMVTVEGLTLGQVQALARRGIDIGAVRKGPVIMGPRGVPSPSYNVEAVVSSGDRARLTADGFSLTDIPGKGPVHKIGEPYDVYKSFDVPIADIRAQILKIAARYPGLAQAGTDDNPAISDSLLGIGYDPGVGADLYITNGEFSDWALDVLRYRNQLGLCLCRGQPGRFRCLDDPAGRERGNDHDDRRQLRCRLGR